MSAWVAKNKNGQLTQNLDIALEENCKLDLELGVKVLTHIIHAGNEVEITPWRAIRLTLEKLPARKLNAFFRLLKSRPYKKRNYWVLYFFEFVPVEFIDKTMFSSFLEFLRNNEEEYFWIDWKSIERFRSVDKNAFVKSLAIINSKIREGKQWRIDHYFFESYIDDFKKAKTLLEDAYLLQERAQDHFDINCKALFLLTERNPKFLMTYIDFICRGRSFMNTREYAHLNGIWKFNQAESWLEEIFLIVEPKGLIAEDNIYTSFFTGIDEITKKRAITFLKALLKKYYKDSGKVSMVMEIVLSAFKNLRKEFISLLLAVSDDFDVFSSIKLVETSYFGPASVNVGAIRANEWQLVLDCLNEITRAAYKYARHKTFVLERIASYKLDADYESRSQLMSDR